MELRKLNRVHMNPYNYVSFNKKRMKLIEKDVY